MNEPKPFASLSPSLLARKGSARPAMRPQLQPMTQFHETTARQVEDDLGWNDMGHDVPAPKAAPFQAAPEPQNPVNETPAKVEPAREAEVVAINPAAVPAPRIVIPRVPEVVRQQATIAERVADVADKPRRSALNDGRRAAFTLRLDAERHLRLRLACTLANRSAQQIVTDALDKFIAGLPEVAELAAQVKKRG